MMPHLRTHDRTGGLLLYSIHGSSRRAAQPVRSVCQQAAPEANRRGCGGLIGAASGW